MLFFSALCTTSQQPQAGIGAADATQQNFGNPQPGFGAADATQQSLGIPSAGQPLPSQQPQSGFGAGDPTQQNLGFSAGDGQQRPSQGCQAGGAQSQPGYPAASTQQFNPDSGLQSQGNTMDVQEQAYQEHKQHLDQASNAGGADASRSGNFNSQLEQEMEIHSGPHHGLGSKIKSKLPHHFNDGTKIPRELRNDGTGQTGPGPI